MRSFVALLVVVFCANVHAGGEYMGVPDSYAANDAYVHASYHEPDLVGVPAKLSISTPTPATTPTKSPSCGCSDCSCKDCQCTGGVCRCDGCIADFWAVRDEGLRKGENLILLAGVDNENLVIYARNRAKEEGRRLVKADTSRHERGIHALEAGNDGIYHYSHSMFLDDYGQKTGVKNWRIDNSDIVAVSSTEQERLMPTMRVKGVEIQEQEEACADGSCSSSSGSMMQPMQSRSMPMMMQRSSYSSPMMYQSQSRGVMMRGRSRSRG